MPTVQPFSATAPVKALVGTAAKPSITFTGDTDTGLYSPGANQVAIATGGVQRLLIGSDGSITPASPLRFPLGSAGAPSISFTGDTNTGIYSPGADQLALSTNGTGKLFIDSAGKVTVKGAGTAAFVVEGSAPNNSLVIKDTTGNVGIGTTPFAGNKLHVAVDADGDYAIYGISPDASGLMGLNPDGTNGNVLRWGGVGANAGVLRFMSGVSTERARIDSSGRLLVGTSTSVTGTLLQVAASATNVINEASIIANAGVSTIGGAQIGLYRSRGTTASPAVSANGDYIGGIIYNTYDGSAYRPAASIQAYSDAGTTANDVPGRLVFSTTADGASSPTERVRINNAGTVYIGANAATANDNLGATFIPSNIGRTIFKLGATADTTLQFFVIANNTVGSISATTTATSYNTSSDYRLKENVTPVTDGITRLQQLKPSRFNFSADPTKTVDGFLAHEVQTIVPEAITGEKDAVDDEGNPEYQGIDQSKMVPLVVAALQEAIAKIEILEQRLNDAGIN